MPDPCCIDVVRAVRCLTGCHSDEPCEVMTFAFSFCFFSAAAAAAFFFFSIRSKSMTLHLSSKDTEHSDLGASERGPRRRARFLSMITRTPTTAAMMAMATVMMAAHAMRMYITVSSLCFVTSRLACVSEAFRTASSMSLLRAVQERNTEFLIKFIPFIQLINQFSFNR